MKIRKKPPYSRYKKRRMTLRKRRQVKMIALIAAAVIIICAGIIVLIKLSNREEVTYREMGKPTLPTITCEFGGEQINRMYGYTSEMDPAYMRETLYILKSSYDINIQALTHGTKISAVDFTVLNVEDNNLIQETQVSDFTQEDDVLKATLHIDNIIEEGQEYSLEIKLSTASGYEIYYYTRVIRDTVSDIEEHIKFIKTFHGYVYDSTKIDNLISYIQPSGENTNNTDFGKVTLDSKLRHLAWGNMDLEIMKDPIINIIDADGEIAYIRMDFEAGLNLDELDPQYYCVSECYRTRVSEAGTTLLNYERTCDEPFIPDSTSVSGNQINIGIQSEKSVETKCSPDGNYNCFVAYGALWEVNVNSKQILPAFTFLSNYEDERELYNQHNIKILNVEDSGNIRFLVYGYMNSGIHEGRCGVGIYTYNAAKSETVEEAFIPSELPYQVLKHTIGSLCYMNSDGLLYIMIDGTIYSIDSSAKTASYVVTGLNENNYIVSADQSLAAWHNDSKDTDAEAITCMDLETGSTFEISAESGKSVKALGFLNHDLVYGTGKEGNIYTDASGKEYLLSDRAVVVNQSGQVQQEYAESGYYYISAEQEYNRLVLNRVLSSQGTYKESEPFTVFATELDEYPDITLTTQIEEVRKEVILLNMPNSTTTAGALNIKKSTKVVFQNAEINDMGRMLSDNWKYFVYAGGQLQYMETSPAKAVSEAYDAMGVVIDKRGAYFYRRGMRAGTIEISEDELQEALQSYKDEKLINITGINLTQAMAFTAKKVPLVWEYSGRTYIIYGYTVSDALMLYDVSSGEKSTLSDYEAEEVFETSGRCFIAETESGIKE